MATRQIYQDSSDEEVQLRFANLVDFHSADITFDPNGVNIESTRYHEPDTLDRMLEVERRDQEAMDQTHRPPSPIQQQQGETMDQTQNGDSPPLPIQQQHVFDEVEPDPQHVLRAEIQEGKRRGSVNYILLGKLFVKDFTYKGHINCSCTKRAYGCHARAIIHQETLIVKSSTQHSCDISEIDVTILRLENKMKKKAEESSLSLRQIYDDISLEHPEAAAKIGFPRMESAMSKRRSRTTPMNPRDFSHLIGLLNQAAAYNQCVKKVISHEGNEGAVIFATNESLQAANSPLIKEAQLDATFQCLPVKTHTGLAQLLIFFVIKHKKAVPVFHCAMTNKTEALYTEVLEWLKEQCPSLNPEKVISDFEKGMINSAEAVFGVVCQGCDWHYCNALLKNARKKKLQPTIKNNEQFSKWFHKIMSLNFLPSEMIEPAFRELANEPLQLSAATRKQKDSFIRYWEKQWLQVIGVDRLSVFRSTVRTNNNCESYNAQMPRKIGRRPGFWPFVRNINRLLSVNDLNLQRLEGNVPIVRNRGNKIQEARLNTLWTNVSGPNPSMTPQHFLSVIANMKTNSKHKYQNETESDSEISENDDIVQADQSEPPPQQPSNTDQQVQDQPGQLRCPVCTEIPQEWKMFQCGHPVCARCSGLLTRPPRRERKCHMCRQIIRQTFPFFPPTF